MLTWAVPKALQASGGALKSITLEKTAEAKGRLTGKFAGTGETIKLDADMVLTAIGQTFVADPLGADSLKLQGGRIVVDAERRSSVTGIWAGGDCVAGGQDLTVSAVEDGKQAALSIDRFLRGV